MEQPTDPNARDAIIDVVLQLLETEGYDEVALREVAQRAHVSLATIYKRYSSRDELIYRALEQWREAHVYETLDPPSSGESAYDGLMRVFRSMFEPWEQNPRLLEAFHRVRIGPRGDRLTEDATVVVGPVMRSFFNGADDAYVDDVLLILENVVYGVVGQFVAGKLDVADILPTIERAVYRLTAAPPVSDQTETPTRMA